MQRMFTAALAAAMCSVSGVAVAEEAAKGISVEELAFMLTGEFDSTTQMQADKDAGVPREQMHFVINRVFVPVTTSDIEGPVLVASTAYGGERWGFDFNEFLVWTFVSAEDGMAIIATPMRFSDQEKRVPFARDGKRLSGFSKENLETARSGALCPIRWERREVGFEGRSFDCRAMSVVHDKMMDWHWRYRLMPDALFVEFQGVDEHGQVLDGTPVGLPYRLDRID